MLLLTFTLSTFFAGCVREHLDVFETSGNEADMALPPLSGSRKGKIAREVTKAPAELGQGDGSSQ